MCADVPDKFKKAQNDNEIIIKKVEKGWIVLQNIELGRG